MAEGETKTRTVETRFTIADLFSSKFEGIKDKVGEGAKKIAELQEKFRDFRREQGLTTLGALGLGYGIGSWVEKIRETNKEFMATQMGIAGVLASSLKFEKGASEIDRYNRSMALSAGISEELEETSGRFNVSLGETDRAYRVLSSAAAQLGLKQKEVLELTVSSLATAKEFGNDGEYAALSIARALQTGTIRGVEPFDNKLRSIVGNMHKLNATQRFQHIERALQGSREVAEQMASYVDGALNRAQTTVTGLIRDATGPLFKEIAKDLDSWAKKLHEARENGKPLIEIFSNKLVGAFHTLDHLSGFIKDHWMAIAGLNIGGRMVGGMKGLAGIIGGIGGAAEGGGVGAVNAGLGAMAQKLGLVVGGLSAFWMAENAVIDAINSHLDKEREKDTQAAMGAGSIQSLLKIAGQKQFLGVAGEAERNILGKRAVDELKKYGIVSNGKLDRDALTQAVRRLDTGERESLATKLGIRNKYLPVSQMSSQQFVEPLIQQLSGVVDQYAKAAAVLTKKATDDKNLPFAKGNTIINGGVHVQMKVEDEDPDRVFIRFQQKIHDSITRRSQPITAEPAGL